MRERGTECVSEANNARGACLDLGESARAFARERERERESAIPSWDADVCELLDGRSDGDDADGIGVGFALHVAERLDRDRFREHRLARVHRQRGLRKKEKVREKRMKNLLLKSKQWRVCAEMRRRSVSRPKESERPLERESRNREQLETSRESARG